MNLDTAEVVIGLLGTLGTLSGLGVLIIYLINLKSERRIKKADARKRELEGDLLSVEYFQDTINQLVKDNVQLKNDVEALKKKVKELEEGKTDAETLVQKYSEAGKECHTCEYNTEPHPCPAIKRFNELA